MIQESDTVDFIIPVYNSMQHIELCIEHIKKLKYKQNLLDIYVVDNGSMDGTIEKIKQSNVKFSIKPELTISGLRNFGAKNTKGKFIAFIDSDVYINNLWLSNGLKILKSDEKIGIAGCYYGIPDNHTWVEKTWYDLKKDIKGKVNFISSGNMLIKRSVFNQLRGFEEKLITGEDYDLCLRARKEGYNIICDPKLKATHFGNTKRLIDIIRKERWYGLGMVGTFKNGEISKPLLLTVFTLILSMLMVSFLFISLDVALYIFFSLLLIPLIIAYYLTRNIKKRRLFATIKCIPIAGCYLIGRILSLIDYSIISIRQ